MKQVRPGIPVSLPRIVLLPFRLPKNPPEFRELALGKMTGRSTPTAQIFTAFFKFWTRIPLVSIQFSALYISDFRKMQFRFSTP